MKVRWQEINIGLTGLLSERRRLFEVVFLWQQQALEFHPPPPQTPQTPQGNRRSITTAVLSNTLPA